MDSNISTNPDRVLVDIADYVVNHTPHQSAIDAARLCLVDALACALDALDHPECTKLLGPLVAGTIVPNGACVPGTSYSLDPATAAFDLGCMIRWLDYNDATSGTLTTHPSDSLAAILMVADHLSRQRVAVRREPYVVRDVLNAMVKAYEIQGALGLLNDFRKFGIDQPLLTRVATTPVVTRLLGGTHDEVLNAVSNAFVETTLSAVRHAPNIGTRKNWATADASFTSVRLAYMAVKGEAGCRSVLSAKEVGFYDARCHGEPLKFAAPYADGVIQQVMFKLVPAGMHGQTAAECAFRLHALVRDRIVDIERITLRCHRTLMRIMDKRGPLRNAADRDHCVQYIVALGLLHGKIGPHDFEDEFAADSRIDALRAKMDLTEDERYTKDFSDPSKRSSANAVQVFFNDGSSTEKMEVEFPAGHPRRRAEALPMLKAKFDAALKRRFAPQCCERIVALFEDGARLEKTPVNELVDMVRVP
ncbi:MAG: bifunctional 2-methylcitrate dehydratase/aconitate hydratase [Burkholderiales bacterium]